ncbi:DUF1801 domain-containing protein [Sinimarinibacterium flocculans]|uniref:DUF1801 domain-containing protein n=1 Tax=Sinimarinibacterium flocculans TaxID=985250 RepID=UPI0035173A87
MKKPGAAGTSPASKLIDAKITGLGDWRGETLARVRRLIHDAAPQIVEEVKWAKPSNPMGVPVWSHGGIVCTGETYKQVVKLTFAKGASLPDPSGLFNASLDGNVRRAIDIREGETLNAKAFKALIKTAVAANLQSAASKSKPKAAAVKKAPAKLLSGGNPQIAKADGDAPVQAYIAAMPGWKSDLGRQLDALIVRTVPDVRKAVKWNSPLYGMENRGWFLSVHVFTHFVKVTFFKGTSLRPPPPGGTPRSGEARWIDIREGAFDAAQMTRWVKQAAKLPGWVP